MTIGNLTIFQKVCQILPWRNPYFICDITIYSKSNISISLTKLKTIIMANPYVPQALKCGQKTKGNNSDKEKRYYSPNNMSSAAAMAVDIQNLYGTINSERNTFKGQTCGGSCSDKNRIVKDGKASVFPSDLKYDKQKSLLMIEWTYEWDTDIDCVEPKKIDYREISKIAGNGKKIGFWYYECVDNFWKLFVCDESKKVLFEVPTDVACPNTAEPKYIISALCIDKICCIIIKKNAEDESPILTWRLFGKTCD